MAHTVEKIGGTSMTRFGEILQNVIVGHRQPSELYNRIFIVSAYGGITNLLLENKKNGAPGVYGKFARDDDGWQDALETVRAEMLRLNRTFTDLGLDLEVADKFVNERLDGIRDCLLDLKKLRTYGQFNMDGYLLPTREMLAAVGEAHSAHNSVLILKKHGINAIFVDLTGWMKKEQTTFDKAVRRGFEGIDISTSMPIVTGYVKYDEGIIHKEYHLCTADPKIIGEDKVKVIGHTNFDIADQLSDLDMEAIHSKAAKEMEHMNIPIRVKNAFDPDHPGTLISRDYVSPTPHVEMICGRKDVEAIEVMDPEMVGKVGYDYNLMKSMYDTRISYIAKTTNANTITVFVPQKNPRLEECLELIRGIFPNAQVRTFDTAIVSVIGTNMSIPGFLSRAANALHTANINVLALVQSTRQVNMQFIVDREDFEKAQQALHKAFVEDLQK